MMDAQTEQKNEEFSKRKDAVQSSFTTAWMCVVMETGSGLPEASLKLPKGWFSKLSTSQSALCIWRNTTF